MNRQEEIVNYANSFKGKGIENEELREVIRLAIIDGATWSDANPKWKPSEEQLVALLNAANGNYISGSNMQTLRELLENLRKL